MHWVFHLDPVLIMDQVMLVSFQALCQSFLMRNVRYVYCLCVLANSLACYSNIMCGWHCYSVKFTDSDGVKSVDDASSELDKLKDAMNDLDVREIGSLLPDDEDELLAGIMDDF